MKTTIGDTPAPTSVAPRKTMVRIIRDKPLSPHDREMIAAINALGDQWVAFFEAHKAAEARAKSTSDAPSNGPSTANKVVCLKAYRGARK